MTAPGGRRGVWLVRALVLAATAVAVWASFARLHVSADLSLLFPNDVRSRALAQYARVFGGGDLGLVLVRAATAEEASAVAAEVRAALAHRPSVAHVVDRAPSSPPQDPTLAWTLAGPAARQRLAALTSDEGMRARLAETRAMLLAPGGAGAEEWLARDPLRLASVPFEERAELAAGVGARGGDPFTADDGKARLVAVVPRGNAFESRAAEAFVADVADVGRDVMARHPGATVSLAGGHAIARATELMLRRDLMLSGAASLVLAAGVFLLTFRRARALLAVLPPLALGTVWTTGVAALATKGLSAIAIAFAAVVVGVGVDTGVHVYAALLDGRRAGLSPADAARHARAATWRPTLIAATLAGAAFASLAWTDLAAMAQLGVLCGIGEVLTAGAILLVTPELGAWLERGAPPPLRAAPWTGAVGALTATRARAGALAAAFVVASVALAWVGWPRPGDQLVAVRPSALAPLQVSDEIYRLFGGKPGQWLVISRGASRDAAAARADAVAEALEGLAKAGAIDGFDTLATFAPSPAIQLARLAERDALDLPARRASLERALLTEGFDVDACAPALAAFAAPAHDVAPIPRDDDDGVGWLVARHLREDAGEGVAVTFVRPRGDPSLDARALVTIRGADPAAVVTSYAALDQGLRDSLARDLPRIALLALALVAVGLRAALGRARDVVLALAALAAEIVLLGLAMRLFGVRWHVYDALVVPVLLGITIDEAMFLLYAARAHGSSRRALETQGPLVVATALTTAAGFAALLVCRFDGLRDLGAVGALGSAAGVLAALVVVPAGLRLAGTPDS